MTNFASNFALSNDWGSGFTANMSIANTGTNNLNGWTLEFDFPYDIQQIWNARIVSRQGNRYVVRNEDWNGTIPPKGMVSFGLQGGPGNVTTEPSRYVLNGQSLTTPTAMPTLSLSDVTLTEGNTGTANAIFTVNLSASSNQPVTLNFATADGTAKAGFDYTATSGTLTFNPGETSKTITVPVRGDLLDEANETFTLNLSNPTNATIADGQGVGTITDNDPTPSFAINDVAIAEGNSGTKNATFTVTLSAASGRTTSVNFATANGTAIAGSDYNATSGTLTFNPGETSKTVSVAVRGDTTVEGNETFNVNLSAATNATIADNQGVGTITNDDSSSGLRQLTISDTTVTEGNSGTTNATFTVNLSAASTQAVSVNFATANGTAISTSDYNATAGTLTFNPGETAKTVTVAVRGDTLDEANETFRVNLSNATNATIADGQGVGTIIDNDPTPSFAINDVAIAEGNSGTKNATFTVNLSTASGRTTSVSYATANGTATAGSDYTATSGTLTFNPGETSKTISVPITGDTTAEGNETFTINLSNPSNATLADGQAMGTITNDDTAPPPPQAGTFNYGEVVQKSFYFYEAQRSGDLPTNNRVSWRGDSALKDGADVGRDLTGGYYDAGDHVKFGFPMAGAMTMLGWGVVEYRDAYAKMGQLDEALATIKWGTDYILKAHVTDSNGTKEFWGQVGRGDLDHAYWGPAEAMTMPRPAFKVDRNNPGSDLTGESAAALAAASIAFRPTDATYSNRLLTNAEQLFKFADTYRGRYSDSITDAATYYRSWNGYNDELIWAATWLYKATGNTSYLNKAETYYQQSYGAGLPNWTHSWDNKQFGAAVLLAEATGKQVYRTHTENWLNYWTDKSGAGVKYTPGGLAWLDQWGSLRYSANTAFVAGIYSDKVNDYNNRYSNFARDQIDYMLGDNPNNFSYVVGFGNKYPLQPHHRNAHDGSWSDYESSAPNDHILYGALVGGPSAANDNAYVDDRTNYVNNEVGLDYNAAFTGAVARMYRDFGGQPLNTFPSGSEVSMTSDFTSSMSNNLLAAAI